MRFEWLIEFCLFVFFVNFTVIKISIQKFRTLLGRPEEELSDDTQ